MGDKKLAVIGEENFFMSSLVRDHKKVEVTMADLVKDHKKLEEITMINQTNEDSVPQLNLLDSSKF